ncbi:hypothetical protein F8M41_019602 [Gigaspora margarita]|uniref:Uncharacterized protein n=1 Tax=Gigaspora margarita TaxID=4874 RepID=A0A8H4EU70_GIGMA|nr:hypothetical protein F8M41_019602 [Gigaspora margarita]
MPKIKQQRFKKDTIYLDMASGTISLKKNRPDGRRIYKNKKDNIIIISNIRIVFFKDNEIIKPPSDYYYQYDYGDKVDVVKKSANVNGVPCFLFGNDLYRYTIFYKRKRIFQFQSMMQFSISRPKCIFSYNRKKNKEVYSKVNEVLGEDDENEDEEIEDIEMEDDSDDEKNNYL